METESQSRIVRVVIVDDQPLVRESIRIVLEHEEDIQVVGEAADGAEAVEVAQQTQPDVLVIDITMPRTDGIEATRRLRKLNLPAKVLILSMYADEYNVQRALNSGANGYALKGSAPRDLITAIRALSRNEIFISPQVEGAEGLIAEAKRSQSKNSPKA